MFGWKSRRQLAQEREIESMRLLLGAVERLIEATQQQNAALSLYFGLIAPDGEPESRTMRDEDEFALEVERMKRARVWRGEES